MKHYTFNVDCFFTMQFTFTEQEVQQDSEGAEGDVEPSDSALAQLEEEIKHFLSQSYGVENMEVYADSDALLGVVDDSD